MTNRVILQSGDYVNTSEGIIMIPFIEQGALDHERLSAVKESQKAVDSIIYRSVFSPPVILVQASNTVPRPKQVKV